MRATAHTRPGALRRAHLPAPLSSSHDRRSRALAWLSSGRAIRGDMAFPQYAGICAATPLHTRGGGAWLCVLAVDAIGQDVETVKWPELALQPGAELRAPHQSASPLNSPRGLQSHDSHKKNVLSKSQ